MCLSLNFRMTRINHILLALKLCLFVWVNVRYHVNGYTDVVTCQADTNSADGQRYTSCAHQLCSYQVIHKNNARL